MLIRAMINAAKADGRLDRGEQQAIINRMGKASRDDVEFVRQEFSRPLDVDQFVHEVPFGMEQQVFAMSLIAIDLDARSEASYLDDLADGLRIPIDVRNQIRQQYEVGSLS